MLEAMGKGQIIMGAETMGGNAGGNGRQWGQIIMLEAMLEAMGAETGSRNNFGGFQRDRPMY